MYRSMSLPFVRKGRSRDDDLDEYNSIVKMFSYMRLINLQRDADIESYTDVDRAELCPEDSFFKLNMEIGGTLSLKSPLLDPKISEYIDTKVEDFGYLSFNRTFVVFGNEQKFAKILRETDCPDRFVFRNVELPSGSWLKPVYGYIDGSEYLAGINHTEQDSKHYHISIYTNFMNKTTNELKVRDAGHLSNMIEYAKYGKMSNQEYDEVLNNIEDFTKKPNDIRLYAAEEFNSEIVCLANCPITASFAFCNTNNNCYVFEPKYLHMLRRRYVDYSLKLVINLSLPTTGLQLCHKFLAVKNNDSTLVFKFLDRETYNSFTINSGRQEPDSKTNYSLVYQKEFKPSPVYERRIELKLQKLEQQGQFEKIIMRPICDYQNNIKAVVLFIWRFEEIVCILFHLANLNWFPISRLIIPAEKEILDVDISLNQDMIHLLTTESLMTYCTHLHEFVKLFFDADRNTTLLNLFYSKTLPFKKMYLISFHEWKMQHNFVKIASSSSFLRFIDDDGRIFELHKPSRDEIDAHLSAKHFEFSRKSKLMRRFFYRRASDPAYAGVPTSDPMFDMMQEDFFPDGKFPEFNWMPSNLWTCYYDPLVDERHLTFAEGIMLTSDQLSLKERKQIIYKYQYLLAYFQGNFQA